jgi:hypothetical protein
MSSSPERERESRVDVANTATVSDNFQTSKKKRSNSDVTEYPRRRATIAV